MQQQRARRQQSRAAAGDSRDCTWYAGRVNFGLAVKESNVLDYS